jgi:ribosomal-protein-alanine N-acetyltransferase
MMGWTKRGTVRTGSTTASTLIGRRVVLRPLVAADFEQWREVRRRCHDWLTKWEPARIPGAADAVEDRQAFAARCGARSREVQLGTGYGFGIFVDGWFAGEINISSIHRGPFQSAYVGYWIDQRQAG